MSIWPGLWLETELGRQSDGWRCRGGSLRYTAFTAVHAACPAPYPLVEVLGVEEGAVDRASCAARQRLHADIGWVSDHCLTVAVCSAARSSNGSCLG